IPLVRRKVAMVFVGVRDAGQTDLAKLRSTTNASGLCTGAIQCRQQQTDQYSDDANHNQQLNEREPDTTLHTRPPSAKGISKLTCLGRDATKKRLSHYQFPLVTSRGSIIHLTRSS